MDFDGSFIGRGIVDVTTLEAAVNRLTAEDWTADRSRQSKFAVHSQTQTIPLCFDRDFRHMDATICDEWRVFAPGMHPLLQHCTNIFNGGYLVRALLTRLPSGGRIPPHVDWGFSLSHSHRLHVPICTNDHVVFRVGQDLQVMGKGQVWEINNMRRHTVMNNGTTHRIHLIVDWAWHMSKAELDEYRLDRARMATLTASGHEQKYD